MKKKLIIALIFVGLISATEPAQAGFFESVGNVVRYTALTTKNAGMALGYGVKTVVGSPFWIMQSVGTFAFNHKKITAATSSAIVLALVAIWYVSPEGFMSHPWVNEVATKITGLSLDALKVIVETTVSILEQGPEYAYRLRELSCYYTNQSCPPIVPDDYFCNACLSDCTDFIPACPINESFSFSSLIPSISSLF